MTTNLLNLPGYKVVGVEESAHDYHINAEISNPPFTCEGCGSDRLIGHGRNAQVIRDMPTHGKRVAIYLENRRWRCLDCKKTFMEPLPAVNAKREMTERLTRWIGQQSLKRTFASIADDTGLDEKTIRNIFRDYVNELEAEFRFETPRWMGIDEIHLIKYRGVITNIQNNSIVELLPNRNKETIIKYFARLEGRETIKYVSIDMWMPYREAVELMLPNATIIVDKFHVVKMANEAMEKVRKSFRESLTPKQRRGLRHDRFVLLKREHTLTDEEVLLLSGWVRNYPELGLAHKLKENFFKIYDSCSSDEALERFAAWEISVTHEVRDAFSDLIRAWRNWQPYIVSYFDHPLTNAYTESLNSLIRVMDRLGRGYSFEALRAKILFTEGAHAHKNRRPKFERNAMQQPKERFLDDLNDGAIEYGVPDEGFGRVLMRSPKPPKDDYPHGANELPKNYGADINTLIALLEAGKL